MSESTTARMRTHTRPVERCGASPPLYWKAFGLQPHRTESFKLSPDPLLIDEVRDIVGLYMNPPDHALAGAPASASQGDGP